MNDIAQAVDVDDFPPDSQPYLRNAAEALAKADEDVGQIIWQTGQSLSFAKKHCPNGRWLEFLKRCGVAERRAQQFISVFERFERAEIPNVGRQLLIELAAPSTPAEVIEAVVERVDSGAPAPTVRELQDEIAKAKAPAPVDYDVDRTRQEPEVQTNDGREAVERCVKAIERQVKKAIGICASIKSDDAWRLLEHSLGNFLEDVKHA